MLVRYSKPRSIGDDTESDLRIERAQRLSRVSLVLLILLMLGLVGVGWYAYPILQGHDVRLSGVETQIPMIQKYVLSLDGESKALNVKLDYWSSRQDDLRRQFNRARGDLAAGIESARQQAIDASSALVERVRSEIASQIASIKTQIARLETTRETDREQIAKLEQDLAQVRSQVNQQAQDLASVQSRVDSNVDSKAASIEDQLAAVRTTQQRDRKAFDAYADKFAVKRVDFEVTKDRGTEVAAGLSLLVNDTDVSYQHVNGSIWVIPERRTIWLRDLKVQEPVFLSSFEDGRTRQLVFTGVNKNGATGYILVPARDAIASRVTSLPTSRAPAE